MTTDLVITTGELLERVVIGGDLSKLTPTERLQYYRAVCDSVSLNPLTRPLEYLHLNGKLILYARKDASDQLRKLHGISVDRVEDKVVEGVYVVTAHLRDNRGRTDSDIGAVTIKGLSGDALANAMMKAHTKAKRRGTLSICGLGMLDETEVETIPDAAPVTIEGVPIEEWIETFTAFEKPEALDAFWKYIRQPELWKQVPVPKQIELGAAHNAAKKRLGVA